MTPTEAQVKAVSNEEVEAQAKILYDKELHHLPFRDARKWLRDEYKSRARKQLATEL